MLKPDVKVFELRDRMTTISIMCVRIDLSEVTEPDRFIIRRAGWGSNAKAIYMINLSTCQCIFEPGRWNSHTYDTAHQYVEEHWDELQGGEVIDAEYIRGESEKPKESERHLEGK